MGALYDIDGNLIISEETLPSAESLNQVPPVPLSTANAMLKCGYTYVDACRNGALTYGDGTGTYQAEGKICCSTFCRQLLQGIPYNDYRPANASTTSASGKRWRYGYRMLGTDFYASDATATAQQMYNQYKNIGRAFEISSDMAGAQPGDLIVFGDDINSISHIGMFVYKDAEDTNYIMDATYYNEGLAVSVHSKKDPSVDHHNAVGIIRPLLSAVEIQNTDVPVTAANGAITGQVLAGYGHFVQISGDVIANSAVSYGSISFTPRYSGKDFRIVPAMATADGTNVLTYSGVSNVDVRMSHYLI